MKNICLLGSTGYIGNNAIEVIKENPEEYRIVALGAGRNIELLCSQIQELKPRFAAVENSKLADNLRAALANGCNTHIVDGPEGYIQIATLPEVDLVVAAMAGAAGLLPTYSAIRSGKDIALANKETLVVAGSFLMKEARARSVQILPIDSEHSAIQQSIQGHRREDLKRIVLTGSGGPFKDCSLERLSTVTPEEALQHPKWKMGKKITIDSATMMNKGLEAIEAKLLFDVDMDQIEIILHPQAIIHSMVEYMDGSIIAQLALPDMRIPISYALSYPRHLKGQLPAVDFLEIGNLSFEKPDTKRFRCLDLALEAGYTGQSMPAVVSGANEIAVKAFLDRKITFLGIPQLIERTMEQHEPYPIDSIDRALEADRWAKARAALILDEMVGSEKHS
ncbi:MAG: 1-deoxy-D-xylulose-5-phosphate reductoisomerase [Deltaproteobacteria bacterium]|nr:1-deoxy-D-xylulose-5-phosphate reductoisomerase [Deltaproteobacteria bacterium]MBW2075959.1 1-deoxy-D-xylulose-5-phosphate reductoisomerase [Deltaproteobacteria bacterium]MBW2309956.1 1-deoxy-D-xylulose-5-phosphate reductoisomerase [Deltaproteobacteria bacterium]